MDLVCPDCGKKAKKHGKYQRWVHTKHQSCQIFVLRRRCGSCDQTFSLLPIFLTPWARFSNTFREFIGRWLLTGVPLTQIKKRLSQSKIPIVSLRTLRRWKGKLKTKFDFWIVEQRQRFANDSQYNDGLLEVFRKGINLIQECEFYLSVLYGGIHHIPTKGRLFTALNIRLPLEQLW